MSIWAQHHDSVPFTSRQTYQTTTYGGDVFGLKKSSPEFEEVLKVRSVGAFTTELCETELKFVSTKWLKGGGCP